MSTDPGSGGRGFRALPPIYLSGHWRKSSELQVVGEVSNGLESGFHRCARTQTGLDFSSDIGLPKLNGIEAARQIHKLSLESKILFVSQESDPEIVQMRSFGLGAWGYVVKIKSRK